MKTNKLFLIMGIIIYSIACTDENNIETNSLVGSETFEFEYI